MLRKIYHYFIINFSNIFWVLIIFLICYRFLRIDFQSPWIDELSTLIDSNPNLSYSELFNRIIKSQVHPPLYFVIIYFFQKIFGYNIDVIRFFSALVAIFIFIALYKYVKSSFGERSAKISLLLLSINACFMGFSQEARSYTFFIFLQILSYSYLNKYYRSDRVIYILFLTALNISLIYTNYFGLFIVGGQVISLIFFYSEKRIKQACYLLLSYFIVYASFIPWISHTSEGTKFVDSWIKSPEIFHILQFGFNFMFPNLMLKILVVLGTIISVQKIFSEKRFEYILLWSWAISFLSFSYLFSIFFTPILAWKYLVFVLVQLIILTSIGLSELKIRFLRYFIIIVFFLVSLYITFYKFSMLYKPTKSEYAQSIDFLKETDLDFPVIVREKDIINWYADYLNLNFRFLQIDSVNGNLNKYQESLLKGWWELHLHRPFFTDSIVKKMSSIDSFYHFRHTNFSTIDLWIPSRMTLAEQKVLSDEKFILYKYRNSSAKRIKVIFSVSSDLPHYSDSRLKISSGGISRSIRLNYEKGVYSLRFSVIPGDLSIVFEDYDTNKPVISKVKIEELVVINDD